MCRSAIKGCRSTRIIQASSSASLHARDKLRNGFGANATAFTACERSLRRVEFNQQLSAASLTLLPQVECFAGGVFGRRKAATRDPLADEGFLFWGGDNVYFHGSDCGPPSLPCQGPSQNAEQVLTAGCSSTKTHLFFNNAGQLRMSVAGAAFAGAFGASEGTTNSLPSAETS